MLNITRYGRLMGDDLTTNMVGIPSITTDASNIIYDQTFIP